MLRPIRRHLTTIVVAMMTAAVTAGGPAIAGTIADYARNANKVDGKHAVGAGATAAQRAGKLVATNASGRLPNNIVAKAPNADKLGGVSSAGFARSVVPRGTLLRGVFGVEFQAAGSVTVNFHTPLATGIPYNNVHYLTRADRFTQECPGYGRAARRHLCVYEQEALGGGFSATAPTVTRDNVITNGASRFGFTQTFGGPAGETSRVYGEWAVRAP